MRTIHDKPLTPERAGRRCPICRRATSVRFRPFCSQRCADLDLGRWLNDAYVIFSDEPANTEKPANTDENEPSG
jgi:hypothetical protein